MNDWGLILKDVRPKLPQLGPLGNFLHLNILQGFENGPFDQAILNAAKLYQSEVYANESYYLKELGQWNIPEQFIDEKIEQFILENPPPLILKSSAMSCIKRYALRAFEIPRGNYLEEKWKRENSPDPQLWSFCLEVAKKFSSPLSSKVSIDDTYNSFFLRGLATYFDQGMSYWPCPDKGHGLFHYFKELVAHSPSMKVLAKKLISFSTGEEYLDHFFEKTASEDIPEIVLKKLLTYRGWASVINQLELNSDLCLMRWQKTSLVDFLAVRLALKETLVPRKTQEIDHYHLEMSYQLFTLMQEIHLTPQKLQHSEDQKTLFDWSHDFFQVLRKKFLHQLNESVNYQQFLQKLSLNKIHQAKPFVKGVLIFCIDDREESLRRNLEEVDSNLKTYSTAGHFGLPIQLLGPIHPRANAHCPPVVRPEFKVKEVFAKKPIEGKKFTSTHKTNLVFKIFISLYYQTRTLFWGTIHSLLLGLMSIVPMILQLFFPRLTEKFSRLVLPHRPTKILFQKEDELNQPEMKGITLDRSVTMVAELCRSIGLTQNFPPFIFMVGHEHTSVNNPYWRSYGCGACSGHSGAPNSRIISQMANSRDVRALLKERFQIDIPQTSHFIPLVHNTCSDEISYFETPANLTSEQKKLLEEIKHSLYLATERSAYERSRHFQDGRSPKSLKSALKTMKTRGLDLSTVRAEYGHSGVFLAVIGRRELTEKMFLDRRAFLVSYDNSIDEQGDLLEGVITAAVPVCANINLDYYFSFMDNEKFGAGSKLPLNVTSLVGVMSGGLSDLRIGLPLQMVEIHKPLRIFCVIEAQEEQVLRIFQKYKRLKELLYNQWIFIALIHPHTREIKIFEKDHFVLWKYGQTLTKKNSFAQEFHSSLDYLKEYKHLRDFLEIRSFT